ncbi:MAG: amino acid permease [Methanobacteriota archaeon]
MARTLAHAWTRKKAVSDLLYAASASRLKRRLGALDLTLLGIGGMIGAGIFTTIGDATSRVGPAIALSFVLAGITCILVALCYAELASALPTAGSSYSYTYASLGEGFAWLVAWNLAAAFLVTNTAVAISWSENFLGILESTGLALPAALSGTPGIDPGALFNLPAFLIMMLLTGLLVVGVRESATVNNLLVAVKVSVLFLFLALGAPEADLRNFSPFVPEGYGPVLRSAGIVFFAFLGFEAIATTAEEVKDPGRNMQRGILASLLVTTVIYLATALVLVGILPYESLANVGDSLARALDSTGHGVAGGVIRLGAIAATTSVILVYSMGLPRLLYGLSRDGLLPEAVGRVHPRFGTPVRLTLGAGTAAALLAALVPLGTAVDFTNIGTLFSFAVVSLAVLALRIVEPHLPRPFRVPLSPFVPLAAAAACLLLMTSFPGGIWLSFLLWTALGVVVYVLYGARRSREAVGVGVPGAYVRRSAAPRHPEEP